MCFGKVCFVALDEESFTIDYRERNIEHFRGRDTQVKKLTRYNINPMEDSNLNFTKPVL